VGGDQPEGSGGVKGGGDLGCEEVSKGKEEAGRRRHPRR
jgi:hypothetical protein